MRDRAQTVIVGAGIVGASAAYHLAELGVDRRPRDRPGPAVRDRRLHLARAGSGLPDERLAHDVPDRAGHGPPLRLAGAGRRAGLVRGRRHRGRDHAGAHGGADAQAGARPVLRDRRTPSCSRRHEAAERIPLLDPTRHPRGLLRAASDGIAKAVRIVTALAAKAATRGVDVRGRRDGHRVRHPRRPRARRARPTGAASSASAC